jgi:acyl-CoA synthetase (NDP forming)
MPPTRSDGMKSFFEPKSIAVAGVSTDPNKLGSIIFAHLTENRRKGLLRATAYALNPAHDRIGDQPCYPAIDALPETPELLIVAVPESLTLGLIRKAAETGVKAAVIVTSGYAEAGRGKVEKEIGELAARHGMRILGPNTIGLIDTWSGVDSLFLRQTKTLPDGSQVVSLLNPLRGEIAIISQSGHLGEVISEELAANGVGIRALVGTGNQLDVSIEDVIQYFADDKRTRVVAVYLEGLRDGRRFMRIAASAARKKPLIVFKVGKTSVGARAALTHTASIVGDYEVYQAAFRQSGIIEATSLQELVDYSISLRMLPRTEGKRLVIVTNAGGVGAIAADEAQKLGLEVEPLRAQAKHGLLSKFAGVGFISNAALGNPIDLTASVSTDDFVKVCETVLTLPQYDLGLVLPTHQTPAIDYDVAERLSKVLLQAKKPVVACAIGNSDLASMIHNEFMANGIPCFPTPERAVRALAASASYSELKDGARAPLLVRGKPRRVSSRTSGPLPAQEVSRLLLSYGIEEPKSVLVRTSRDLGRMRRFGFPVVCKLQSVDLLHKTEAGGVILGVANVAEVEKVMYRFRSLARKKGISFDGMLVQEAVEKSIELILGGTRDPSFGPVLVVGLGGIYTELIRDYALAVAPVTPNDAAKMLEQTKAARILQGYRGGPRVGIGRLSRVVSAFSRIMVDEPTIAQIEVNPLMVSESRFLAVDSRVIVGKG